MHMFHNPNMMLANTVMKGKVILVDNVGAMQYPSRYAIILDHATIH